MPHLDRRHPNAGRADTASTVGYIYPLFTPVAGGANNSLLNINQSHVDSFRKYPLYNAINTPQPKIDFELQRPSGRVANQMATREHRGELHLEPSDGDDTGCRPVNYDNDYLPLGFDRRNIFNLNYSLKSGQWISKQRLDNVAGGVVRGALNGWRLSGIVGYQSGINMPSVYGTSLGMDGTLTLGKGTMATLPNGTTSSCASATCSLETTSTVLVGSPDYTLQPRISKRHPGQ